MTDREKKGFPRSLFTILAVGGLLASGIYLGVMRIQGPATWHIVKASAYGVFGLLMLWGAVAKR